MSADGRKYERQLVLHGFGPEHQRALGNASAFIARGGGVGGTVALYLAAAGIGRIVLMHGGDLDWPDLNRQILMREDGVGTPRAAMIRESLLRLNADLELTVLDENPDERNINEWIAGADVVCDCPPTFEERYALNAASVRHRKPMVEAAMIGMEAHLTVFVPGQTPCLRCLYPDFPVDWCGQSFPVLGAVSGMVGCLAAIEAIKVLTGFGKPLLNQLLTFDTEVHEYRKFMLRRDPACPVCGHLPGETSS